MKRSVVARIGALFGTLALVVAPAFAGDPQGRKDDDRLTRTRAAYRAAGWPAPGPARAGVNPGALGVGEWQKTSYDVDPRRGEGVLRLARGEQAVVLTARLFDDAAGARGELIARLATMQRVLDPVPGVGEVSYGVRDPAGRWSLVLAARGNVLFDVRAAAGDVDAEALLGLTLAFDRQVLSERPIEPGQAVGPRLLGVRVSPARAGVAATVTLDADPAGLPADFVAFECTGGAGVLETDAGFELMAPRAGTVRLVVFAASKDLRVVRAEVTVEVGP